MAKPLTKKRRRKRGGGGCYRVDPANWMASLSLPNTEKEEIYFFSPCPPPTSDGGMQNGSSVGIRTRCVHVFCTFRRRLVCSVGAYWQNFCIGAQSEVYEGCVVGWAPIAHSLFFMGSILIFSLRPIPFWRLEEEEEGTTRRESWVIGAGDVRTLFLNKL